MARSIVERAAPAGDDGWRRGRRMARDLRGTMRVVDFVQFDAGYERRWSRGVFVLRGRVACGHSAQLVVDCDFPYYTPTGGVQIRFARWQARRPDAPMHRAASASARSIPSAATRRGTRSARTRHAPPATASATSTTTATARRTRQTSAADLATLLSNWG